VETEATRQRRGGISPVLQFAGTGLIAVIVVGVAALFLFRNLGEDEAVRDARSLTRALGTAAVEPALTARLIAGDPAAVADFDRLVRRRVLRQGVVRVKLWTEDGRVAYSDEHRLIGARYPLSEDDSEVFDTGAVEAEESDLSRPENRFERQYGELLEVYMPVHAAGAEPLLFEAYIRQSAVAAGARRIWRDFAPFLAAALVLLWAIQIPLARSLAQRLRQGQQEREQLLLRALEASNTERRRIAADLHDGVVQDLAGTSMSLDAAAGRAAPGDPVTGTLRDAAQQTRRSMRRLRSLLVEIYPPNLQSAGLEPALQDLLAPLLSRGIQARLESTAPAQLPREAQQVIFRTAQEALRNVAEHAGASRAIVRLDTPNGHIRLSVEDDGRGFSPDDVERRRDAGHIGLALLADRAADLGGRLDIASTPGEGTRVTLEVPWR
jgi:signal transduction histidine kinase